MASSELPVCSWFPAIEGVWLLGEPTVFSLLQTGFGGLSSRFEKTFHFV